MVSIEYILNPFNRPEITSAPTSQTTYTPLNDVITGAGYLQWVANAATCVYGNNAYQVWITNVTATVAGNGIMNVTFTIAGGLSTTPETPFDVFAIGALTANGQWSWMGQGYACNTYTLPITNSANAFIILGTPQDTDGDGLTDAYEMLVSKSSPTNYSTDGTGMADGWEVLYFGQTGVNPNGDPDGDQLTTYQEWLMNSKSYNPVKWNTFTNGVGDGFQNYSGDGLANLLQVSFGGNMLTNNPTWKANAANDGFPDEYKIMMSLSTNSAVAVPGLPSYSKNPVP
jgi:hypothetical protein